MASTLITAPILTALLAQPHGMTAKEVALALTWTATKASRYLGIMFFAGGLSRTSKPSRTNNEFVYTIAPPKPPRDKPRWVPSEPAPELAPLPDWAKRYGAMADDLAEEDVV